MTEESKPIEEHAHQMEMRPHKTYACLWCNREIQGEPAYNEDGQLVGYLYRHDNVPHPENATYDEEDHPQ